MSHESTFEHAISAAHAPNEQRLRFVRRTYLHLGSAVLLFSMVCAAIVRTPAIYELLIESMPFGRFYWLFALGLLVAVGWLAEQWARRASSIPAQYLGLALTILVQAVWFAPLLAAATASTGDSTLPSAAATMAITVFGGLTLIVLLNRMVFSFIGRSFALGSLTVLGLVLVACTSGATRGALLSFAIVAVAAGCVIYRTPGTVRRYDPASHVAAALALFAGMALLPWYILRAAVVYSRR